MTPEEKRDRRKARHELEAKAKRHLNRCMGMFSTGPQLRSGRRMLVDQFFAMTLRARKDTPVEPVPESSH